MTTQTQLASDSASQSGADILAEYAEQSVFSSINRISSRTTARYRNQPDGLPWVAWGGKVYIPIAEGREWLKNQVRRPNQRRRT